MAAFSEMSATNTAAPLAVSSRATALPMPAPVTIADRPPSA
jgi:hypothetical protein